jgi:plastocyanin
MRPPLLAAVWVLGVAAIGGGAASTSASGRLASWYPNAADTVHWLRHPGRPASAPAWSRTPGQGSESGSLRGRVDVGRPAAAAERRPRVADLGSRQGPDDRDARPAVVYLESTAVAERSALRAVQPDRRRVRMDQRNETFVPGVLAVGVGTLVDFPNNDTTFHNVFSMSPAKRFDLGRYGRGKSKPVQFDTPGIVRVFCDIHSHMSASVLVFNHPFYATTAADGRYVIDSIPAGTYVVTAWHEGAVRDSRTVTIPAGGAANLDFLVR